MDRAESVVEVSLWRPHASALRAAKLLYIATKAKELNPGIDLGRLGLGQLSMRQLSALEGFGKIAFQIPEKRATVFFGKCLENGFDDRDNIVEAIMNRPVSHGYQVVVHGRPYAVSFTEPRGFRDKRTLIGAHGFSLVTRCFSQWQEGDALTLWGCRTGQWRFHKQLSKHLQTNVRACGADYEYGRDENGPFLKLGKDGRAR